MVVVEEAESGERETEVSAQTPLPSSIARNELMSLTGLAKAVRDGGPPCPDGHVEERRPDRRPSSRSQWAWRGFLYSSVVPQPMGLDAF